jgi:hypothetical protein
MENVFLIIIIALVFYVLLLIKWRKKTVHDVLLLNSALSIMAMCSIGIALNDKDVWLRTISFIGVIAIVGISVLPFIGNEKNKNE